jgi:hypothetical protein
MRSCLLVVLLASLSFAQAPNTNLPSPRIASFFPCGAQAGSSVEVTVTGTDLDDATAIMSAHAGISAERTTAVEAKAEPKADDKKKDMAKAKAAAVTSVRFKLTVKPDVPPGQYDLRVLGKFGVSNPRFFTVGARPEVNEVTANDDVPAAQRIARGCVVNGVIDAATDVDYYVFSGKKGERVILHCAAGSIDSRARPLMEVYAADGRTRLALNRNYSGTDALVDIALPADSDYYVRVSEFAYVAGGADYFYRLIIDTGAWLDAVFPPMIDAAKETPLTLIGRGLPGGAEVGATIQGRPVGLSKAVHPPLANAALRSFTGPMALPLQCGLADGIAFNSVTPRPLFFATAPIVLEAMAPNDTFETAQKVPNTCEVAGSILSPGDRDCYQFELKAGDMRMIDLHADRLGTVMDAFLTIRGPDGATIAGDAQLDDDPEYLHPTSFFNRTTDPAAYKLTATKPGYYSVMVATRDGTVNHGPRAIYRLRIAPPQPDFRAMLMPRHRDLPWSANLRPDGDTALDVFVHRIDGFNGPVTITLEKLPKGVTAMPALVGPGQRWGTVLLRAAKDAPEGASVVKAIATSEIDGKAVSRDVRSGSIIWGIPNQAGGPTLARLDQFLPVAVRGGERNPLAITAKWDKATIKGIDGKERPAATPLTVKAGESITVPVAIAWRGDGARPNLVALGIEATKFEQNLNALTVNNGQAVNVAKEKNEATLTILVQPKALPGRYVAVLRGDTKLDMLRDSTTKEKKNYTLIAFAEPMPVTVQATTFGKLSAGTVNVKPGKSTTLTVRVERQFDYTGPFELTVSLPEASGVTVTPSAIAIGANEATLLVTAAADAKPATLEKVLVKSSVQAADGSIVQHEAKATIIVGK